MASPYWDGTEKTKRHPYYRAEEQPKLKAWEGFVFGTVVGVWIAMLGYVFFVR